MTVAPITAVGAALDRLEGREKVTGEALYAYEYQLDRVAYAAPIQAAIAKGEIRAIDAAAALAAPGVLAVLSHENAPRLTAVDDGELFLFQSTAVAYRGQFVAAIVAESLESAREAAELVQIEYAEQARDVQLDPHRPDLLHPAQVNGGYETDSELGDFEATFPSAAVKLDHIYTTPACHNNPMEPHATVALWEEERLTLYDSNQGAHAIREGVAQVFGIAPEQVRVITKHVGGGFGAKVQVHPPQILAAMASKLTGRPVKVALTRQQMFAVAGYRTPTIQRLRLGADKDGRLAAIAHDAVSQTSTLTEFAEQTAVATRIMYVAPNRRTTHRLARLDVPTPAFMRAPGACPGMFALESAIDELAIACDLDPIELRIRNEPDLEPETGVPFSSRNLLACLREGASRFGWEARDPVPRSHVDGSWLVGTGVAASTYPAYRRPSAAHARAEPDGSYTILIDATDLGTGARTALTQIAADALEVTIEHVRVEIGDSVLPRAPAAGGSMGTASWGSAIDEACRRLRKSGQPEARADTSDEIEGDHEVSGHAFGAQFAEVRVDLDTGEVRVPRLLGIFAAGRIINPKTARSQLIGGMTMGLGMALLEESVMDAEFGDYLNHDLAQYHVAACADVQEIEADWIDEHDPHLNRIGVKGIGEIGIVGTAAAVANAVHHATGNRIRDLPIRLDKLLRRNPTA